MTHKFFHVEPIGEPIEIKPPYTVIIQNADGGLWIHHVDAEGKPAGGEHSGIQYDSIDELFARV
jgi:hypothetical protein